MKEKETKYFTVAFISSVIIGLITLIAFLYFTNQLFNPLVIFIIGLAFILPVRRESFFVRRIILLFALFFIIWLFSIIGSSITPFVVAFIFAYLFDPFVTKLNSKGIPRWLSSLVIVLLLVGITAFVFVLIAPAVFNQLNELTTKITSIYSTVASYLEVQRVSKLLDSIGIHDQKIKELVENEFLPELKFLISTIINSLSGFVTGLSQVARQIVNAILIPIFSFYFLKDFHKAKRYVVAVLEKKNQKLLYDLTRVNEIFRIYVGWQVFAAFMVGSVCSVTFYLLNIEFSLVLGILCGFLNPIPYLGLISSMLISSLTILLIAPENMFYQIIAVVATISIVHFINAYFVEPNVLGKKVGLHPLILFLSLFIFGGLFGLLGLLIAVPTTAALMLFLEDWAKNSGIEI